MRIHLVGLGKMGANLALNLKDHKHEVIGFDLNDQAREVLNKAGIETHDELSKFLVRKNNERLVVWLLIPNNLVDQVIDQITPYLNERDIIVDGGNSNFNKSIERYNKLKSLDIEFVDVGTSGGTEGARHGACLMVGGTIENYEFLKQVYQDISAPDGFGYMGGPGSGHFVKMVHNGIEYGMMQAIGEGFELIEASPFDVDYHHLTKVWNSGSIIESALVGYIGSAFSKDAKLSEIQGRIDDSGEGKWMVEEALNLEVAIPVIAQSLFTRYKSRDEHKFSEKVVAAMRNEFGGHAVYKKKK